MDEDRYTHRRPQAKPSNYQATLDAVIKIVTILAPALILYMQWKAGNKLATVDEKADKAAIHAKAAAIETASVKADLKVSTEERDAKLDKIEKTAAQTNAVTLKWRAEHTGDPDDMNMAKEAAKELTDKVD